MTEPETKTLASARMIIGVRGWQGEGEVNVRMMSRSEVGIEGKTRVIRGHS